MRKSSYFPCRAGCRVGRRRGRRARGVAHLRPLSGGRGRRAGNAAGRLPAGDPVHGHVARDRGKRRHRHTDLLHRGHRLAAPPRTLWGWTRERSRPSGWWRCRRARASAPLAASVIAIELFGPSIGSFAAIAAIVAFTSNPDACRRAGLVPHRLTLEIWERSREPRSHSTEMPGDIDNFAETPATGTVGCYNYPRIWSLVMSATGTSHAHLSSQELQYIDGRWQR